MKTLSASTATAYDKPSVAVVRTVTIAFPNGPTLYLCDKVWGTVPTECVFNSQLYEPIVNNWTTIETGELNQVTFEAVPGQLTIEIDNTMPCGGFANLGALIATHGAHFADVTVTEFPETGSAGADANNIFKGKIEDPGDFLPESITLICSGMELYVSNRFSHDILEATTFASAREKDLGKMLPQVYGSAKQVPFLGADVGSITTLAVEIGTGDTVISITDFLSDFPSSGTVIIDNEQITYTGKSSSQLTGCSRAANYTAAASHLQGAVIQELQDAEYFIIGHAVKAIDTVYATDPDTGRFIRQVANYTAYTGQAGDQHATYGAKAVIEISRPAVRLPTGIILLYKGGSAPSGWTLFSDANDRFLIGAGDTYSPTDTGGSLTVSGLTETTDAGGDHLGSTVINHSLTGDPAAGAGNYLHGSPQNAGDHTHTYSSITWTPEYQDLKLIKADSSQDQYPADSIVLMDSNTTPDGLSSVYTDELILRIDDTVATDGPSGAATTSSETWPHYHYDDNKASSLAGADPAFPTTSGGTAHHHNGTLGDATATHNLKRVFLRAYTSTSAFAGTKNMIGMWEGATAPAGWTLCDGTNGTPDLEDYFVILSNDATTANTGDNTVTPAFGTISGGFHNHDGIPAENNKTLGPIIHPDNVGQHNHPITTPFDYVPPYYAITFITRTDPIEKAPDSDSPISADIDGFQDDGSGTYTGTPAALIERPDHIAKHIIIDRCGLTTSEIDATAYTAAGTFFNTNSYVEKFVVKQKPNVRSLLSRIMHQARAIDIWEAGVHHIIPIPAADSVDIAIDQNRIDLGSFGVRYTPRVDIKNTFRALYDYFWTGFSGPEATRGVVLANDSVSATKFGTLQGEPYNYPYIAGESQAQDVINLRKTNSAFPRLVVRFAGGYYLSKLERGDVIRFDSSPDDYLESAFSGLLAENNFKDTDSNKWINTTSNLWAAVSTRMFRLTDVKRGLDTIWFSAVEILQ